MNVSKGKPPFPDAFAAVDSSTLDDMPDDLRDACRHSIRELLVVSTTPLAAPVSTALKQGGWEPIYARNRRDVERLSQQHRFMVGVVLLPQPFDEDRFVEYRDLVGGLRHLEWIAALDRDHIARDDVKRFIIDLLRDFQVYPLDPARLSVVLGHACGLASIGLALRREHVATKPDRYGLVGSSAAMRQLYFAIERIADVDLPVLILGETGTGKEVVARAFHARSERAAGPFVALNCAAISSSLLQSELFGYERGAFTKADERKVGLIEAAAGGTLLLDEIGEIPLQAQTNLLRFLDDKKVTPIGATQSFAADVRVIATTNRALEQGIRDRTFREDLFYRLAVFTVRTPPLRERDGDIDALAQHFLEAAAVSLVKPVVGLTEDALSLLHRHDWPGNVRELRSCVVQAVLACSGPRVTAADLRQAQSPAPAPPASLTDALHNTEKATLQKTLSQNFWNIAKSARELGVSRMTLYRLMAKHQISRGPEAKRRQ